MRKVVISGDVLRDINQIVIWLKDSGYPPTKQADDQWDGPNWRIARKNRLGARYPLYDIEIDDTKLMTLFLRRWG